MINQSTSQAMCVVAQEPPNQTQPTTRGRPRSFDRDAALDAAVLVFWEKGYEGTSLTDLTAAMGINRPSLYATYGNKRDLFMHAIDRYAATHGSRAFSALRLEPDNRTAVEEFFKASIDCALVEGTPRGCLINTVATDAAESDPELRDKLSHMFRQTDAAIAKRMAANQPNSPDGGNDPEMLAHMAHSVTHSIMTRARTGATRQELTQLAGAFTAIMFPSPKSPANHTHA
jgi:AcrR family transcriptional regulator